MNTSPLRSPLIKKPLRIYGYDGIIKSESKNIKVLHRIYSHMGNLGFRELNDLLKLASDSSLAKNCYWEHFRSKAAVLARKLKIGRRPEKLRDLCDQTGLFAVLIAHILEDYGVIAEPAVDIVHLGPRYFDYALGVLKKDAFEIHAIAEVKRISSLSNIKEYSVHTIEDFQIIHDAMEGACLQNERPQEIIFLYHVHLVGDLSGSYRLIKQTLAALEGVVSKYLLPRFSLVLTTDESWDRFSQLLKDDLKRAF